jgi:superfamily II DNA helicase RecQ
VHPKVCMNFLDIIKLSLQHISKVNIEILPQQQQAINFILSGRDTAICLPTAFGKSLIYELASLCFDLKLNQPLGTSQIIVLSPLISLTESQVKSLQERGLKAIRLARYSNSTVMEATYIFLSPEAMCES